MGKYMSGIKKEMEKKEKGMTNEYKKNHGLGKSSTGCLSMTSQKTHGCCSMKEALSKASLDATHPQSC
jgi:hypothetical protein